LTGGEPFLHPDIFRIVKLSKEMGFRIHIPTNGKLLNENTIRKIKSTGVDLLTVSLDHFEEFVHDKIRNSPGSFKMALKGIEKCKKAGINVVVTTVINKFNVHRIEEHVKFVTEKLDVPLGFCFPSLSPTEEFFVSHSDTVELHKNDLIRCFKRIIKLKKSGKEIYNTTQFLMEAINYLRGKPVSRCLAGKRVFYCNWEGKIFPCFNKSTLGNYNSLWKKDMKNCNDCFIQCFREPSIVYQHPIKCLIEIRRILS